MLFFLPEVLPYGGRPFAIMQMFREVKPKFYGMLGAADSSS